MSGRQLQELARDSIDEQVKEAPDQRCLGNGLGIAESVELRDHLCHVLAVLAAMPDDQATRFARACVQPAVETMHAHGRRLDSAAETDRLRRRGGRPVRPLRVDRGRRGLHGRLL